MKEKNNREFFSEVAECLDLHIDLLNGFLLFIGENHFLGFSDDDLKKIGRRFFMMSAELVKLNDKMSGTIADFSKKLIDLEDPYSLGDARKINEILQKYEDYSKEIRCFLSSGEEIIRSKKYISSLSAHTVKFKIFIESYLKTIDIKEKN